MVSGSSAHNSSGKTVKTDLSSEEYKTLLRLRSMRVAEPEKGESAGRFRRTKEEFDEEVAELRAQVQAGVLDVGQDDYLYDYDRGKGKSDLFPDDGTCFAKLCRHLGVSVSPDTTSVSQLSSQQLKKLSTDDSVSVGCVVYGKNDTRNHVVPVVHSKSNSVSFSPVLKADAMFGATYAVTSTQGFFNMGGVYANTDFYSSMADFPPSGVDELSSHQSGVVTDDRVGGSTVVGGPNARSDVQSQVGGQFGEDSRVASGSRSFAGDSRIPAGPPPPESIIFESEGAGSNNLTKGVVRAKRRVVRGLVDYEEKQYAKRGYGVSGVTMFNNVDEMFLDTISRDYAQEIVEEFFRVCGIPTDQPSSTQYAEDVLWAFIVARTASNKADYNVAYEVPVKGGTNAELDFSKLSLLLNEKFGLTRRNFSRGVANDVRGYLMRPENQFVKVRAAQRVGADNQYGALCFDGSTGCTNVTTSELTFCKLLEGRNLYERDDVIAQGASDKIMQGIHGGVRSVVQR